MSYLWKPSEERVQSTLLEKFMKSLPSKFDSYHELHKWSIENIEDFWSYFWNFSGIKYSRKYDSVLKNPRMPGAKWFEGAELNYAENLLSGDSDKTAIISTGEDRSDMYFTFKELNQEVARVQNLSLIHI